MSIPYTADSSSEPLTNCFPALGRIGQSTYVIWVLLNYWKKHKLMDLITSADPRSVFLLRAPPPSFPPTFLLQVMISQISPIGLHRLGWKFYLVFICTNIVNGKSRGRLRNSGIVPPHQHTLTLILSPLPRSPRQALLSYSCEFSTRFVLWCA